jgi:hypothetical protein
MPAMTAAQEDLETRALTLPGQAKALKIVDQQSYQTAAERLLAVAELRREIVEHHAPMKRKAHEAWQAIISAEKKLLDPVAEAERILKAGIATYEAERRAEEQRERELEQAEAEGADAVEVAAMIAAPLPLVAPPAPPMFQAARGITTAVNWKGQVTSLEALVKAIAAGQASVNLVQPNESAINQLARATRGSLQVPGIRFSSESIVRAGRR